MASYSCCTECHLVPGTQYVCVAVTLSVYCVISACPQMESKNRNTTETEKMLRKQFVKQQIKDREDHKRELRAKDKELEKLKAELDGVSVG